MNDIRVVDAVTGETLPGIPTARLIEKGVGEAYFIPNEDERSPHIPGVWYLREGQYQSPLDIYQRVRIVIEKS